MFRKYTKYRMFLVPFYKSVEGQPSNSLTGQTLEVIQKDRQIDRLIGLYTDRLEDS